MIRLGLIFIHDTREGLETVATQSTTSELTGDPAHRESVNMHNEENAVGSKAMCWNATSPSCVADTYGPHALKKSCTERKCWNATTSHRELKHDRLDHNFKHMLTVSLAIPVTHDPPRAHSHP